MFVIELIYKVVRVIDAIVREDPFVSRGLADVRVIQFQASTRADDMPKRLA
ncbi:MAG TPA: hypothetical protein VGM90_13375 [Kofleriaceae bacterium]|jgi:hypothetical protein